MDDPFQQDRSNSFLQATRSVGLGPGDEQVRFGSAERIDRLFGGDLEAFHQYVPPEAAGIAGRPVFHQLGHRMCDAVRSGVLREDLRGGLQCELSFGGNRSPCPTQCERKERMVRLRAGNSSRRTEKQCAGFESAPPSQ